MIILLEFAVIFRDVKHAQLQSIIIITTYSREISLYINTQIVILSIKYNSLDTKSEKSK